VPSVFEFAPKYINTVFKGENPSAILFYTAKESTPRGFEAALFNAFTSVAKTHKYNLHFVTAGPIGEAQLKLREFTNVQTFPNLLIINPP